MTAWIFRVLRALNVFGILLLPAGLPDGKAKFWPSPIPEPVRDTYLGVVHAGTRHFATASQEAASVRKSFAAVRAAQITDLGEIPLVVLTPTGQDSEESGPLSDEDEEQLRTVSEELQDELAALSPNGRRVRVPDCGHYIQIEQPDAVVDAIRAVVEAVEG